MKMCGRFKSKLKTGGRVEGVLKQDNSNKLNTASRPTPFVVSSVFIQSVSIVLSKYKCIHLVETVC